MAQSSKTIGRFQQMASNMSDESWSLKKQKQYLRLIENQIKTFYYRISKNWKLIHNKKVSSSFSSICK